MKNFIAKNWFKLVLPASILLGCVILGSFFYASQISKQESIERQQQIDLQGKKEAEQIKAEQDKKEYIVKRKKDCYDLETSERKKFTNVDGSSYDEKNDVCIVRYLNGEWEENDPESCGLFDGLFNSKKETTDGEKPCTIQPYFTKTF